MLARTAERVYWLGRFLERTENTARLILVRHHAILDLPKEVQPGWDLLLQVLGAEQTFASLPGVANEKNIIGFVFGERENPSSIISSLTAARENMRTTREIMPSETWERINSLYLSVARRSQRDLPRGMRHSVLNNIIQSCQQITGMLAGTMNQDAAYQFIRMGRNLERADMSTRIIDAASAGLMGKLEDISPYRNVLWISVLQSLSAYQMYRLNVQSNVSPRDVLEFLFQSKVFPRSLAHCLIEIENSMQLLPDFKPARQVVTKVRRNLGATDCGELVDIALHDFIDEVQLQLIDVHQAIANTWFAPADMADVTAG
ncbi:MAG: alpha-E domain-containing protein [Pseudomonadales bacterium]|nr:alpha-E domain-containing protein [Halioglobus sp.]MCP5130646.1 alpha-E domain-containing protein [Pseudomonadales bacterium]